MKINLNKIMKESFDRTDDIPEDAKINETSGWDSLAHINLMVELQNAGVGIDPMDIPTLTSYEAIKAHLNENDIEIV